MKSGNHPQTGSDFTLERTGLKIVDFPSFFTHFRMLFWAKKCRFSIAVAENKLEIGDSGVTL